MSSFVSVIMPTHNKAAYLERTLTGFLLQTYPHFELVIVDDGSSDATAQVVEAFAEVLQIQFVQQEQSGRSAARNAALDVARGRVLVFNDDDRIPTPGFIEGHLARLEGAEDRISVGRKLEVLSIYDADIRLETDSRFLEFL